MGRVLAIWTGMIILAAAPPAQSVTEMDYSGDGQFVVNQALSDIDIHIEIKNSSGSTIGSGSDNNIAITGYIAATIGQSGSGGLTLETLRFDDLYLQTTRGISMSFPVSIATANVSSTLLTIMDNGPSSTRALGVSGGFAIPNYSINSYGTINWNVRALGGLVNESGTINMAEFNPGTVDIDGTCTRVGDNLIISSDLSVVLTSTQTVDVLGELEIITSLNGHLEALAPFQAIPDPPDPCVLDRVGAMGDSLTDDQLYAGYPTYQNWAMQLSSLRAVNFGPGDAYNRAISGATTASLLSSGQHTALVADDVTLAVINIGGNDLLYHIVYAGVTPSVAQVDALAADMISNFDTAVTTVAGPEAAPSGRKMILFQAPALHRIPVIIEMAQHGMDPAKVDLIIRALDAYNTHIKNVGIAYGFPVIDAYQLILDTMGTAGPSKTTFMLGDKAISLALHGNLPALPTDGFWNDGLNPNTPLQGMIANLVIEAVKRGYGEEIGHLTDQEIFAAGGGTPTPGLTTYVDLARYVFVPGSPRGDVSGDGQVDALDMAVLAQNWLGDAALSDITPYPTGDNITDLLDWTIVAQGWLDVE